MVVTAPIWIGLVALALIARSLRRAMLYALAWGWWIGRARRRVLFVYSDSPNWKAHVETSILPRLPANAVVLNWSHRATWPALDPSAMLFRGFAGERELNPIGLVFERFAVVARYRFWQPFRDARHGRVEPLHSLERLFLEHARRDGSR